jgi:diketogulonate reductase-like aldo/keto reductase
MHQIPFYKMIDGNEIPAIGFGTVGLRGNAGTRAIMSAIDHGYRLIDSAYNYENEGTVGEAIRKTSVPRQELFITSKLPGRNHGYEDAVKTIQESLYRANLDYYDLYIIHWPNPIQGKYVEAWQALIDAQKWGFIRSIGVSNFLPEHIDTIYNQTGVLPALNQIELHPFFNQEKQRQYHKEHAIITESWSPLARAKDILENKTLQSIAKKYNKSTGQIILRWHYQLESISIPRSSSPIHQKENIAIFDFHLADDDMQQINRLTTANGRLNNQNPAEYEEF